MKVIFSAFMALSLGVAPKALTQVADSDDLKLQSIRQRAFQNNQPHVLAEAVILPPEVALPFLSRCLQVYRNEKGPFFKEALSAIETVDGYEQYFAAKLDAASKSGGVDNESFEILSLIGTPKAQAVIAPYLFDFAMTPSNGHTLSEVNALSAAFSLGNMNLRDAPTKVRPDSYKSKDITAWQEWAIDRGLVAHSQKAHVPGWLIEIESQVPTPGLDPAPAVLATPSAPATLVQGTKLAVGGSPATPNNRTSDLPAERKAPVWPWLVGIAALTGIAVLVWNRRA
jgi:hypothetical protein